MTIFTQPNLLSQGLKMKGMIHSFEDPNSLHMSKYNDHFSELFLKLTD